MKVLNWLAAGAVGACLAGCGAEEIASAGGGGTITINDNRFSGGGGSGGGGGGGNLATPAGACPTISNIETMGGVLVGGLKDDGTISGPTGEYRVCTLPAVFKKNTTLSRIPGVLYRIDGRVDVGYDLGPAQGGPLPPHVPVGTSTTGIALTIDPGVILYSTSGPSWLLVNRGNQINAAGTAARPIIFTSRDDVAGFTSDSAHGQWGGIVMNGRAPITDCATGATPGSVDCYRQTEGSVNEAWFGGATPTDNSGTLKYVQIRYSGYVLSGNSELQSLTLGGVGSGTTIDHIHSHNSSDDGFEVFGGRVKLRYFVITGADDDSVDVDTGYKGTIQYVIAVQKSSGAADSMVELDTAGTSTTTSEVQTPRTNMKLANFTLIHQGTSSTGNNAAVRLRGGADATFVNGVVVSSTWAGIRVDNSTDPTFGNDIMGAANAGADEAGSPIFRSVLVQGAGGVGIRAGSPAAFTTEFNTVGFSNNASFLSTLTNGFVNGANETSALATDPKTLDTE
ncbi:MAG: hypothetical protein ABI645_12890, partial [Pseudomonadota bacterium]